MHFKLSSAICFNLDQCKILSSGNGLRKINISREVLYGQNVTLAYYMVRVIKYGKIIHYDQMYKNTHQNSRGHEMALYHCVSEVLLQHCYLMPSHYGSEV